MGEERCCLISPSNRWDLRVARSEFIVQLRSPTASPLIKTNNTVAVEKESEERRESVQSGCRRGSPNDRRNLTRKFQSASTMPRPFAVDNPVCSECILRSRRFQPLANVLSPKVACPNSLLALRTAEHGDCWLCFFPLLPPLSLTPLLMIVLHSSPRASERASERARAVVFHCCERMQIAIPVPGPSINSNRINSSAVIVFCASQKTPLYARAVSRVLPPLRTISGSYEWLRASSLLDPGLFPRRWAAVWKLDRMGRGLDITSAIDHFIGNYRQRFVGDVGARQRQKKD